ncbi:Hypothetical predicted protein [Podarcis lilfordi]|uniref:Secreted protein n=1 Tax=Podarcis lilfordi TaxID=74358 RepID=A0AA35NWU3_9SAUR|nr:Hypothetical predicted protein [Podarcis lilfordi]
MPARRSLSIRRASLPFLVCRFLLITVEESVSGEASATETEAASAARQIFCICVASRGGAGTGTAASRSSPSAAAAAGEPGLWSRARPSQAGPSNGKSRRNLLLLKLRAEGRVTRQRLTAEVLIEFCSSSMRNYRLIFCHNLKQP